MLKHISGGLVLEGDGGIYQCDVEETGVVEIGESRLL